MIRGAIFDVDGTLLDSMMVWRDLGARYLEELGLEAEEGLGDTLFSMSLEEGASYLIRNYRLNQTVSQVIEGLHNRLARFYAEEAEPKPGAKELLERFGERKIPMVIATSGDRENAEAALERLGFLKWFQRVFTCSEIGKGKTEPDIYLAAAEMLGGRPEEIWVFEDTLYGIRTAKKAGFLTAAVRDESSEGQREEIQREAAVYLEKISDFPLL